jgi:hypothetical protein
VKDVRIPNCERYTKGLCKAITPYHAVEGVGMSIRYVLRQQISGKCLREHCPYFKGYQKEVKK